MDEKIEVNLYAPLDGEKRFVGINKGMDEEHNVILEVENKRIKIPKESIGSAKRYFDFNE
ncbi:MAG TPA: hypothetical protein DHN33_00310 [Eubacteriaceae bacterium]|nr:hypothetical protein [Eubacteriaceae bacterium]